MRGYRPRVSGRERSSPLSFANHRSMSGKSHKVLSIFVDESGTFRHPDPDSRFYVVGMVFHDQGFDIQPLVRHLDQNVEAIGLDKDTFYFHAGPLIRKEKGYAFFNRNFRGRIFGRMMTFARKAEFRYHCLSVDKKFVTSSLQIASRLQKELVGFLAAHRDVLDAVDRVKVYYDCGQAPITNLLHQTFSSSLSRPVEFAQGVRPENYKLFQLADLICTLHLIELKIVNGERMTPSEFRFFGSPRMFERNVLRKIKGKEI